MVSNSIYFPRAALTATNLLGKLSVMSTSYAALARGCTNLISWRPFISRNELWVRRARGSVACFINPEIHLDLALDLIVLH